MGAILGTVKREGCASVVDLVRFGTSKTMLAAAAATAGRAAVGSCRLALHASWEQPYFAKKEGVLVVFDGRLDNGDTLRELLCAQRDMQNTELVARAYTAWREDCFTHLRGEWALAIVDSRHNVTYLARDPSGARPLYYAGTKTAFSWSTYLESLDDAKLLTELSREYLYRYLVGLPISHLTPYQGVLPVLPGHIVSLSKHEVRTRAFWAPIFDDRITASSEEFEAELFRLFAQSVARRTPMGENVVAQLSGGMDSSCIVGMSDHLRREQGFEANHLLPTISFVDAEEPHSNEAPFIAAMERHRGRSGNHLQLSYLQRTLCPPAVDNIWLAPGGDSGSLLQEECYRNALLDLKCDGVLSGIGGDELLGGVPTGFPEMADLLNAGDLGSLLCRMIAWCLPNRACLWEMLGKVRRYGPELLQERMATEDAGCVVPAPEFCRHPPTQDLVLSYIRDMRPSTIGNALAWWSIHETQPSGQLGNFHRAQYLYPYLDQDLVEFLLRVPREQLVEPGKRRSLMKRSLGRLLPEEVLSRRRKGYVSRTPVTMLARNRSVLLKLAHAPLCAEMGLVNRRAVVWLVEGMEKPENFQHWPLLLRFACLELWLRGRADRPQSGPRSPIDFCPEYSGIASSVTSAPHSA